MHPWPKPDNNKFLPGLKCNMPKLLYDLYTYVKRSLLCSMQQPSTQLNTDNVKGYSRSFLDRVSWVTTFEMHVKALHHCIPDPV